MNRQAIFDAIEGTPYDPHEDITGGDPREMDDAELTRWSVEVIFQVRDAFNEMGEKSPRIVDDLMVALTPYAEADRGFIMLVALEQFTERPPQEKENPTHVSHLPHPTQSWGVGEAPCLECESLDYDEEPYLAMLIRESMEDGGFLTVACEMCSWAGSQDLYDHLDPLVREYTLEVVE